MAVLVAGETAELSELLGAIGDMPAHEDIRRAECGLVMVRGRIGGDGAPFNLGEATVARAAVRLASGEVGFGYVLGRDREKARLAALCDALLQSDRYRAAVERHVLEPIRARLAAERKRSAEQTAATRVDFFTLVRGEDE
jgi:alpha-D-ribose 1-methylphosphonate 5-triphosphate synthase subunit PhnG